MVISLKCVKIKEKLLWKNYRKSSTFFQFFGRRHIYTFSFASTAIKKAVFALFLPVRIQQSVIDVTNGLFNCKPFAY